MRIKVGIEAQHLFSRNKPEAAQKAGEFIRKLVDLNSEGFEFIIFVRPGKDECISSSEKVTIAKLQSVTDAFWEQVALPAAIQKYKPDVLHCTSGTAPLDPGVALVLTVLESQNMGIITSLYRKWVQPKAVARAVSVVVFTDQVREFVTNKFGASAGSKTVVKPVPENMIEIYRRAARPLAEEASDSTSEN
ncbi:MAG: hypothetical protein LAT84_13825 [Balneolia bacterium]|nr:hypothetical protein [Balneolia bacterium]